jgi:hypothetical protein
VPLIPAGPLDQYREATLWPSGVRGVVSNETALSLYELSDVNPAKIHITVPRAHRPQRATPVLYVVHRADLRDDEITAHEGIPIVTPVRGVLDAYAAGLGPALIEQAIADGQRRGVLTRAHGGAAARRDRRHARRRAASPAPRHGPRIRRGRRCRRATRAARVTAASRAWLAS